MNNESILTILHAIVVIDVIDWIESRRTSAYGKTGVKQTWRNVARNMAVTARFFSRIRFNIVEVNPAERLH